MVYGFVDCGLDRRRRELSRDGDSVDIEQKVLDVLGYLVAHRDRVVPKEELLSALWPDLVVVESALTRAVRLARSARLGPRAARAGARPGRPRSARPSRTRRVARARGARHAALLARRVRRCRPRLQRP
ncbi:MAG: winged helix-turn-helix domain-containing protein [Myxococcota bacterium]|nr:winged helix-turn-helix domain-containing protein [Myxococcota bacterium]